jgi:hypothetical protein
MAIRNDREAWTDDGAAHELLTEKQTEAVCNAVGTALAAAIASGWIAVTPRRQT